MARVEREKSRCHSQEIYYLVVVLCVCVGGGDFSGYST